MARFSLRAFTVIAFAILIGTVSVVPVRAANYRVFEYFHFEGLPDDHCQIEPTWGPEQTAWQGCNYHASNPIAEGDIKRFARDIDVNGVIYTCVGWRDGSGSITETGGWANRSDSQNYVIFSLDSDSSITWIYRKVHAVKFQISGNDSRLSAWGTGYEGQLGLGSGVYRQESPTLVPPDTDWSAVTSEQYHTLAIKTDGTLWAWGYNNYGQLGLGTTQVQDTPAIVGANTDWVAVTAGRYHTLAIKTDGTLWAWGYNYYGQLGLGTAGSGQEKNKPTRVGSDADWVAVSAGYMHTVAIKTDGTLWAWGYNYYGQLGLGTAGSGKEKNKPTRVGSDNDWVAVSAGYYHTVAIKTDGTLWAWGHNYSGQLGLGDTTQRNAPTQVITGPMAAWKKVDASGFFTLAIRKDNTLWAWGQNFLGQLGLGDTYQRNTPTQVAHDVDGDGFTDRWVAISGNYGEDWYSYYYESASCFAIKENGTLWAWGHNFSGQLGLGHSVTEQNSPAQVGSDTDWVAVSAGVTHTMAIRGAARFEFRPFIGSGFLPEGMNIEASGRATPTDGTGAYYLTNWNATPAISSTAFTVESDLDFTWTYAAPVDLIVSINGLPASALDSFGAAPAAGSNQFAQGSEVALQVDPVVTDPSSGVTYVCIGWTGTGDVPASGTEHTLTIPSLDNGSTIQWNFAEARSLTTEFDGLPEHLQGNDQFDPRGFGAYSAWDPIEPVWLSEGVIRTVTIDGAIYDKDRSVRYVFTTNADTTCTNDGADADGDGIIDIYTCSFNFTNNATVTWAFQKEVRLRIDFGMGGSNIIISDTGLQVNGTPPAGNAQLPIDYYFKPYDPDIQVPGETYSPVEVKVDNTVNIGNETKNCIKMVVLTGNSPLSEDAIDYSLDPVTATFQLTKPTAVVWNYINAEEQSVGSPVVLSSNIASVVDASQKPAISLLSHEATSTPANSFYWDETGEKLYATRPLGSALLKWNKNDGSNQTEEQYIYIVWPTSGLQNHIVGAPINLQPSESAVEFEEMQYSEAYGAGMPGPIKENPMFDPPNAGKSLLRFSGGETDPPLFIVVESELFDPDDAQIASKIVDVGKQILPPPIHKDPEGKNGYIFYENAYYDGFGDDKAYDRSNREGQIIPVNETTTATPDDRRLVVVWYETGAAAGLGWPVTPIKYTSRWPDTPDGTIVIASGNGSDPLAEYEYTGQIYYQPDKNAPGYNPNEEHALLLGNKVYAVRNDLNTYRDENNDLIGPLSNEETSKPYVLLKFWQPDNESWQMKVFNVEAEDDDHKFAYSITAGKPIVPLMPLDALPRMTESEINLGQDWYHRDHKGGHWAKSANWSEEDDPEPSDAQKSKIVMHWYYSLQSGFYYPPDYLKTDGSPVSVGDPVPFLNLQGGKGTSHQDPPIDVAYVVSWPEDVPVLNIGETLTAAKYGLPDIVNWAAGEVIFDEGQYRGIGSLARLFDPFAERSVPMENLPADIQTEPMEGKLRFPDLPFSLRTRLFYDPVDKKLIFKGITHDPGIGDPLLLPNVMTLREKQRLQDSETYWHDVVAELYTETRDRLFDGNQQQIGVPMALTAGAAADKGYVVLTENDHESLEAAPVALHIIRVDNGPYRGEIKVLKPDDVFDEKLTLRHSGDFGGEPEKFYFTWYYKPDTSGLPPGLPVDPSDTSGWTRFDEGVGMVDITIEGAGKLTLSDNWFMVHYYYGDQPGTAGVAYPALVTDPEAPLGPKYWSQWAGAPGGETAQLAEGWIKRVVSDLNPLDARVSDFRNYAVNTEVSLVSQIGQRYEGDIALSGTPDNLNSLGLIEAYETVINRARDFSIDAAPAADYGPANNAILNAVTRIAGFYTALGNEAYADAQDPTIGFDFDTRGGEVGQMASSIFAFQNQLDSLLEEELTLLRGRDDSLSTTRARPVYNRLVWNFTNSDGELAYAGTYNIRDRDESGVVDELDAKVMYPQGHGDAWGHYLTAMKAWYKLLRHDNFTWEPRVESVLVGGAPIPVDYLDERKFAETAAAKARTGAEIVNLSYRRAYVDDPAGQWQGYKDTDSERAWGFDGWARRAGQGAYFDWVVANAMLPEKDAVPTHTGIQKIDRGTVPELTGIATEFRNIQAQADQADRGLNPIGLAKGVVPFDINPDLLEVGSGLQAETHFDQVYQRAVGALENANTVFKYATQYTLLLRDNDDNLVDFKRAIEDQERGYNYQLIEIFGYPYAGDIGTGGTYKSGYEGPDLFHWMYVDLPDLAEEELMSEQVAYTYTFNFDDMAFDLDGDPLLKNLNQTTKTDPDTGAIIKSAEITYYIDSERSWRLKPAGWGERRAPGQIQMALSDLIKAHADYKRGLTELEGLLGGIQSAVDILEAKHGILAHQIEVRGSANTAIKNFDYWIAGLQTAQKVVARISGEVDRWVDPVKELEPAVFTGWVSLGPATVVKTPAVMAGTASIIKNSVMTLLALIEDGLSIGEIWTNVGKEHRIMDRDRTLFLADSRYEVQQMVKELETKESDVRAKLQELFTLRESIQQAAGQVQTALSAGERVLTEREVFRKRAAGDVQDYRYEDMAFRVFRNDGVQKYRATFELAARYAYLAATAYDFETNLLGSETGSGRAFLTSIVRQRSPGVVLDGVPVVGERGLADPLARMSQNYEVYRGQLGFNNPQIETNRFSLRKELFRFRDAGSASLWRDELDYYRVNNLWNFPPFKRFCRPFADEAAGPQPGIVIPFSTEVNFGYNFFGWPLGAGDSAYDPSSFATKIRAVGLWFEGYDTANLSSTPRVYLIPVGADVLRAADADNFVTREFHVVDQKLPVPFPVSETEVADETWIPVHESLSDVLGGIRRFSSFRAFPEGSSTDPAWSEEDIIESQSTEDTRLIGRSVWNTQWLLIIPGGILLADPDAGLDAFINDVTDIKLFFQTYAYSGN